MSDARLRELERSDDAGDLAARVRLITERLRVGAITMAHVRLAAFVGDGAAQAIAADAGPDLTRGLNEWWIRLIELGNPEVAARSFCAVASLVVQSDHTTALRQVMDWCVCPCHVHGRIADGGLPYARREGDEPRRGSARAVETARLASSWSGSTRRREVRRTVQGLTPHLGLDGGAIRRAIQAALAPWLLGDFDPLLGDRPTELTGAWTCALIGLQDAAQEARVLEIMHDPDLENAFHELRQLDALWRARLPHWPMIEGWSTGARLHGPGGFSVERAPSVWVVRSFARWSAFVGDAELRRALIPALETLGELLGSTSVALAPDDGDLAAAARGGADLDALVARLTTLRGPPASSRLDDERLPEGPNAWWFVPLLA